MIKPQPMQPIYEDENGTVRFQKNSIVDYLIENGNIDLNQIATIDAPREDREQFAQLIGYSLGGYSELSYVSNESYETAVKVYKTGQSEFEAKCEVLSEQLAKVKNAFKSLVPDLFNIHPDDLEQN